MKQPEEATSAMYHNIDELREGYDEIPEDERSDFLTYCEQMVENGLYVGPTISLYDPKLYN